MTTWRPGNGLPNASLRAILETREGTLWVPATPHERDRTRADQLPA